MFGYYYHLATAEGLIHRGTNVSVYGEHGDRPFVLSRAFFSGALVWCVGNCSCQMLRLCIAQAAGSCKPLTR